jgi:hypothetical protein
LLNAFFNRGLVFRDSFIIFINRFWCWPIAAPVSPNANPISRFDTAEKRHAKPVTIVFASPATWPCPLNLRTATRQCPIMINHQRVGVQGAPVEVQRLLQLPHEAKSVLIPCKDATPTIPSYET